MSFQSEKFFFVETLLHIDSTPEIDHSYLLLEHDSSQAPIVDSSENMDFFQAQGKDEESGQLRQIGNVPEGSLQKLKSKKQRCHCKKTRCLKMYCECFSQGISCSKDCVCIGCHNDQKSQRGGQRRGKNGEKVYRENVGEMRLQKMVSKGCNCKKSHCLKKYCECRNGGRKCGESCVCVECKNGVEVVEEKQKYSGSSGVEKSEEEVTEQENFGEWQFKQELQSEKKEEGTFIVMSTELLAEIDGYITA